MSKRHFVYLRGVQFYCVLTLMLVLLFTGHCNGTVVLDNVLYKIFILTYFNYISLDDEIFVVFF